MREAAAILIGYLLGSVLPAYLIGRARGIDLRAEGEHNAGTTNAFKTLGLWAAVPTAVYDLSKGLLAMLVAWWLGVSAPWMYAAGAAAVVGHRFPVWLRFRGAQGMAATIGLLFYCLVTAAARGWLAWYYLPIFLVVWGLTVFAFHSDTASAVFLMPALTLVMALHATDPAFFVFFLAIALYIFAVNLRLAIERRVFRVGPEAKAHLKQLRVYVRPLALLFPLIYLFVDKYVMLLLVGSVALVFIAIDTARVFSARVDAWLLQHAHFFFRPKEARRFTSASLFLAGTFLTLFLFPKAVASLAIVFATIGDLFAKYVGVERGRIAINGRTLEGSLAFLLSCAAAGAVWSWFQPVTLVQVLVGAVAATLTEAAPIDLNDNFTVPLMSGALMTIPAFFGVPGF